VSPEPSPPYRVEEDRPQPRVVGVFSSPKHSFSKAEGDYISLIKGIGVQGDAHCGITVQHLFEKRRRPGAPNLRQVHLLHSELLDEVIGQGFSVRAGDLGENILTRGIDLPLLPTGTLLRLGATALVRVTGLRTPCVKIDRFQKGLLAEMFQNNGAQRSYLSGVMGVVVESGLVRPQDVILVHRPAGVFMQLPAL
jgi:MOSC domain-containing protein YiiM